METVQEFEAYVAPFDSPRGKSFEEAVQSLRASLRSNPNDTHTMLALGMMHYWHGNISKAVEVFEQAVAVDSSDPAAFYHLGVCHFRAARWEQASEALERAIELGPNFTMAHYWLGICSYHQGNYEKALRCFETICRMSPEALVARYHAALSCMALGRWEDVRDHLEVLAVGRSPSPRVALYLGRAYYRLNEPAKAIEVYRRALEHNPNDEAIRDALTDLTEVQEP